MRNESIKNNGLPFKTLILIPFRFAIEMVNRGWICRNVIIWYKPNVMPSSAKDRFTVDWEYLFFFTKSGKYWFEQQFEPSVVDYDNRVKTAANKSKYFENKWDKKSLAQKPLSYFTENRNKRCVWRITTKPYKEAHFATYPEALCEIPIKAGCPKDGIVLDMFFGAGTTGLVALKQNKKFIGIELNPKYIEIANKRLKPFSEQTKLGD